MKNTSERARRDALAPEPKCLRISCVPLGWSRADLLDSLRKLDQSLEQWADGDDRLSLYPAPCGSTQTALLCSNRCTELQPADPTKPKYVPIHDKISGKLDILIDRNFYNLTPLNVPEGEIVAESVYPLSRGLLLGC
jgi:hypothetical protein